MKKEYLKKTGDEYSLMDGAGYSGQDNWIEIPSGADTYLELNKRNLAFYKDNFKYCYLSDTEGWVKTDGCSGAFMHFKALWKRKEYLFKHIDGRYHVVYHDCQGRAIEIPEGAVRLTIDNSKTMTFWKNNLESMNVGQDKKWVSAIKDEILTFSQYSEYDHDVLWSAHTQPEELPFVDDGPKNVVDSVIDIMCKNQEWVKEQAEIIFKDQVNHPSHYASGSIECIEAIESSMTKEAFAGFLKGNVQKYMWRYESKGGVESLQKAQWYLNRLILLQSA